MKLVKMLTPPIKASVISVFVFAVAPVWAFDWPTGGGSVTIPSGEVAEISSAADVAAVAALDEIVFADETAAVLYTSADALALKAALTGTGHFIANGGNENDIIAIACINDGESYGGSSYWFTIGSYSSIKNAIRWANKKLAKHGLALAI